MKRASDLRLANTTARTPAGVVAGDPLAEPQAFERALARLCAVVDEASRGHADWLERVRAGLVAFLGFFDDCPGWGRLLLNATLAHDVEQDAERVSRREQRLLGVLTQLFDDGSPLVLGEVMAEPQLVSELVAGGVLAVVRRRMLAGERGRFVELAPELMAFVAAPYLGQDAARAQLQGLSSPATRARGAVQANGRVIELPIRVTHRTTQVLRAIAAAPGVSNRDIAREAGPIDQGQLSNLLTRLAERGLIENRARDDQLRWPNAWRLTRAGERVLALIGQAPSSPPRRRVRGAR